MEPFTARTVRGSGRGRHMGIPTINLHLQDIPEDMREGVYAAWVTMGNHRYAAALHYGPRPVHGDTPSCEVHLLDTEIASVPGSIRIHPVEFLRKVRDFPDEAALIAAIHNDIAHARTILTS